MRISEASDGRLASGDPADVWGEAALQIVDGAFDSPASLIHHVRVDHRSIEVFMPEQFLDRPNVVSRFEQVSREAMPEGMTASGF
jgi:hypothetical protein